MRKITTLHRDDVLPVSVYPLPVNVRGQVSARLMSPPDYEIYLCLADVGRGAELSWGDRHSEQIVYVFEGTIDVGDLTCEPGGAVVIEGDVPLTIRASSDASIAHFGSRSLEPPDCPIHGQPATEGRGVHLIGPGGITRYGHRSTIAGRWLANGRCPTCRAVLFEVARDTARQGKPHTHSASEIIYVVEGMVRLGSIELPAGSSLCIPGDVRYAEASGPSGATFLNFRPTGSVRTNFFKDAPPEIVPEVETGFEGFEHVNDVVTFVPA